MRCLSFAETIAVTGGLVRPRPEFPVRRGPPHWPPAESPWEESFDNTNPIDEAAPRLMTIARGGGPARPWVRAATGTASEANERSAPPGAVPTIMDFGALFPVSDNMQGNGP
jgi:hypothetical protein